MLIGGGTFGVVSLIAVVWIGEPLAELVAVDAAQDVDVLEEGDVLAHRRGARRRQHPRHEGDDQPHRHGRVRRRQARDHLEHHPRAGGQRVHALRRDGRYRGADDRPRASEHLANRACTSADDAAGGHVTNRRVAVEDVVRELRDAAGDAAGLAQHGVKQACLNGPVEAKAREGHRFLLLQRAHLDHRRRVLEVRLHRFRRHEAEVRHRAQEHEEAPLPFGHFFHRLAKERHGGGVEALRLAHDERGLDAFGDGEVDQLECERRRPNVVLDGEGVDDFLRGRRDVVVLVVSEPRSDGMCQRECRAVVDGAVQQRRHPRPEHGAHAHGHLAAAPAPEHHHRVTLFELVPDDALLHVRHLLHVHLAAHPRRRHDA
mmetsp:Transcript_27932/g.86597  ORF Transcript_27932/g.86597 Transcript_27932/m.86597 type:complete len:373 (+) Transcript_27932:1825-2943(+)